MGVRALCRYYLEACSPSIQSGLEGLWDCTGHGAERFSGDRVVGGPRGIWGVPKDYLDLL